MVAHLLTNPVKKKKKKKKVYNQPGLAPVIQLSQLGKLGQQEGVHFLFRESSVN